MHPSRCKEVHQHQGTCWGGQWQSGYVHLQIHSGLCLEFRQGLLLFHDLGSARACILPVLTLPGVWVLWVMEYVASFLCLITSEDRAELVTQELSLLVWVCAEVSARLQWGDAQAAFMHTLDVSSSLHFVDNVLSCNALNLGFPVSHRNQYLTSLLAHEYKMPLVK